MKKLFYFLMAIGLALSFQACSSDSDPASNSDGTSNTNGNDIPLVLKTIHYTPSEGEASQIDFVLDNNKLVRIKFGTDKVVNYFYEGDLIIKQASHIGQYTSTTDYEYDADGRLIRSYFLSSSLSFDEETIDYNGNMATIQSIHGTLYDEITSERLTNLFFNNGNVIARSVYGDDFGYEFEFTYDDKPNVFNGIIGLDKLQVVQSSIMWCSMGKNNTKTLINLNNSNHKWAYTYEYNSRGYPIHIRIDITSTDGSNYQEEMVLEYY